MYGEAHISPWPAQIRTPNAQVLSTCISSFHRISACCWSHAASTVIPQRHIVSRVELVVHRLNVQLWFDFDLLKCYENTEIQFFPDPANFKVHLCFLPLGTWMRINLVINRNVDRSVPILWERLNESMGLSAKPKQQKENSISINQSPNAKENSHKFGEYMYRKMIVQHQQWVFRCGLLCSVRIKSEMSFNLYRTDFFAIHSRPYGRNVTLAHLEQVHWMKG